ncbi:MAG: hypothetical protein WKF30_12665 [Pyrinomonadaceae bacterium]
MSLAEEKKWTDTSDGSRRNILIATSVVGLLIVGGLIFFLMRATGGGDPSAGQQRLEAALRPGNPEFDQLRERIVIDTPEATEGTRPIGDVVMELTTVVRNFTGRTISGLELKGAVVDLDGHSVKERIVTIIPARQPELDNNKTMQARIVLDSISKDAVRANIKMEVVAVKFR